MSTPARKAVAVLCRAGLVAVVLALIAGIFGMHVLTGTHIMHTAAAAQAPAAGEGHLGGHGPHRFVAVAGTADGPGVGGQCSGSGGCADTKTVSAACVPSAKTGSLAAPLPGAGIPGLHAPIAASGTITSRWSYLPGGPSPGELCISRT